MQQLVAKLWEFADGQSRIAPEPALRTHWGVCAQSLQSILHIYDALPEVRTSPDDFEDALASFRGMEPPRFDTQAFKDEVKAEVRADIAAMLLPPAPVEPEEPPVAAHVPPLIFEDDPVEETKKPWWKRW